MVWRLRCYRKMGRLAVIIYFNFASIIQYGTSESKSELADEYGTRNIGWIYFVLLYATRMLTRKGNCQRQQYFPREMNNT